MSMKVRGIEVEKGNAWWKLCDSFNEALNEYSRKHGEFLAKSVKRLVNEEIREVSKDWDGKARLSICNSLKTFTLFLLDRVDEKNHQEIKFASKTIIRFIELLLERAKNRQLSRYYLNLFTLKTSAKCRNLPSMYMKIAKRQGRGIEESVNSEDLERV